MLTRNLLSFGTVIVLKGIETLGLLDHYTKTVIMFLAPKKKKEEPLV